MRPLVSIIIPIYKVEKYLAPCLDSVLASTYKNIEVLCIDDHSPDNSKAIISEYNMKDSRVHYLLPSQWGGVSRARNFGIEEAKGEYLMFVDGDDRLDKEAIETLYQLIVKYKVDIAEGDFYSFSDFSIPKPSSFSKKEPKQIVILDGNQALDLTLRFRINHGPWAKLYKREALKKLRFIPDRFNEDAVFLFHLYLMNLKIAYIPYALYGYRFNDSGLSKTFSSKNFDIILNIEEMRRCLLYHKKYDLLKALRVWANKYYGNLFYTLKYNDSTKKYTSEFKDIKKYLRHNFMYILLGKDYTLKDRVKAVLSLI